MGCRVVRCFSPKIKRKEQVTIVNLKERDNLGNLHVVGRIVLKCISKINRDREVVGWMNFAGTVMYVLLPRKADKLLINWATTNFLRILLQSIGQY